MPSPVGHSLMGFIIYLLSTRRGGAKVWLLVLFCLFAANIPDLDFLPGIIIGDLRRFHHGISHSIAFSLFFGLLMGAICNFKKIERFDRAFAIASGLYLSHIILDYLVLSPGRGVPLFWPFSDKKFMIQFVVFPYFNYTSPLGGDFFRTVFSFHNLKTIAFEILLLVPLLTTVLVIRRIRPKWKG